MMKSIAVFGALDTKSAEFGYLAERIRALGCHPVMVDLGVFSGPEIHADIRGEQVALAGGAALETLRENGDRAAALETMANGAAKLIRGLWENGSIQGAVSMGGGQGTYMAAVVMRALPIGLPKLIVSTIATSAFDQQQFEGINDTMVINPLVDVAGDNAVLQMISDRAASAIVGMVKDAKPLRERQRRRIAVTMWGVTTPCVNEVEKRLIANGYDVWVFHATGIGGRIMENLILQGEIDGVVDLTLAELGNQICEGTFAHCDYRCDSAGKMGIPQILSVGGLDMIKYVPPESLPAKFASRKRYMHNANLLFVRSSVEENDEMGRIIAEKANASKGETAVFLPLKGISAVDKRDELFWQPESDEALFAALRRKTRAPVELIEMDAHINDREFAAVVAQWMTRAMLNTYGDPKM